MDKIFRWDDGKNKKLISERGLSFEAIVSYIEEGNILAIVPGRGKFGHQKQLLVLVDDYVHIVPYVEEDDHIFLKTIIPSRKWTRRHLTGGI